MGFSLLLKPDYATLGRTSRSALGDVGRHRRRTRHGGGVDSDDFVTPGPGSRLRLHLRALIAAAAAVPLAVWGAALGHVVLHLRGRAQEPRIVFWVALAAAAAVPAVLGYELWSRFAPR